MNFDYNKLNNLRIHELRDLARNVGVKSPTSLKKTDIIEKILLILSGENEPYVNVTKQGRPSKALSQIGEIVDFFVPKNAVTDFGVTYPDFDLSENDEFDFLANSPQVKFNEGLEKPQHIKGYLDIHKNGYGIVRVKGFMPNNEDVFIHIYSIKTNGLNPGDLIEGEAKTVQEGKPRVLYNIISVNGKTVEENKLNKKFENLPYTALNLNIEMLNNNNYFGNKKSIQEGSRNLFLLDGGITMTELKQLAEDVNEDKYKLFIINLNAKPEENTFTKHNVILENVSFNLPESVVVSCTNLAVERAKREVENGKKVIVIINNFTTLIKSVNNLENKQYLNVLQTSTIYYLKNFIMCAKNVADKSSLTLLLYDNVNMESYLSDFVKYDFAKLF